jgi:cell division protein FtsQ
MVKKVILYVLFFVILIGCFVLYAVLSKGQKYENIVYHIEYPSDTLFTEDQLAQYVQKNCVSIVGKSFDSVNLTDFERIVDKYPYLEDADVINNKGTLIIKAKQEKIVAKIFNQNNEQFLLAESGKLVPSLNNTAGRIVVANGSISNKYVENYRVKETKDTSKAKSNIPKYHNTLYSIWRIARFIENDSFWKAQIGQIYVNENQEIELVPTVGEHVILFGRIKQQEDTDRVIAERFGNLKNIYAQGFRITGWDKYQTINLKFGTEIPCGKRIN